MGFEMPNAVPADQNQAETNEPTQEQRDAWMKEAREKFFERREEFVSSVQSAESLEELRGVLKSFAVKNEANLMSADHKVLYSEDPGSSVPMMTLEGALGDIDSIKSFIDSSAPEQLQNLEAANGTKGGRSLLHGKSIYGKVLYDKVAELADKRIAEKTGK